MTYTELAHSSLVFKRSVGTDDRRARNLGTGMSNRNERSRGQDDGDRMLILKTTLSRGEKTSLLKIYIFVVMEI